MVPFTSRSFQAATGVALSCFSAASDFWNSASISAKIRFRSQVVKSFPGAAAVWVRCMNRQLFCWK